MHNPNRPHLISLKGGDISVVDVKFRPREKPLARFDNLICEPAEFKFKGKNEKEVLGQISKLLQELSHQKPLIYGEYEIEMPSDM